jgi:hypothetical protein
VARDFPSGRLAMLHALEVAEVSPAALKLSQVVHPWPASALTSARAGSLAATLQARGGCRMLEFRAKRDFRHGRDDARAATDAGLPGGADWPVDNGYA